jgi:ribosomal protein L13
MPEYGTMSMLLTVYWVNSPKGLQWGNINPSLAQAVRYHLPAHYPSDSFSIVDCGDYVIVTNSRKVKVTGKKEQQVLFRKHSTMIVVRF